jgi:hypothetical protein
MTPDQSQLLDSLFDALLVKRHLEMSSLTGGWAHPAEVTVAADLLDDIGRSVEADWLRNGGTLVRLPATRSSPARVVVLTARSALEQSWTSSRRQLTSRIRWYVNNVPVGYTSLVACLAARIQRRYAIELDVVQVRLLGKKVFSTT